MKRTTNLVVALIAILWIACGHRTVSSLNAQTSLRGKVVDETGEPVILCNVLLRQEGVLITGANTDFDGLYAITDINPGTYEVEFSYVGLQTQLITDVLVKGGQENRLDVVMGAGVNLEEVVVVGYQVPLIEQDMTTTGGTITAEEIRRLPPKNTNAMVGNVAGTTTETGENVTINGSRSNNTIYWIDGMPVANELTASDLRKIKRAAQKELKNIERAKRKTQNDPENNTEEFTAIHENPFLKTGTEPYSTFSIDVDQASYSMVRSRIQQSNSRPDPDAVRIEEMVNYFTYSYGSPKGDDPFAAHTDLMDCPWNAEHYLLRIGLKGQEQSMTKAAPNNLVFLLDVSGSMQDENKLPLVKKSLEFLIQQLRPQDQVAIVVYAGAAGVVLPPTSGDQQATILAALNGLRAGGSTAGGAGIELAYQLAEEQFKKEGNNRVILATDGDFNVGVQSVQQLEKLIENKRNKGIYLTALGFGMGNYKDNRIEVLADKGNGNYAYIDTEGEAQKVFGRDLMGTLYTIAKDVKIQLLFNPDCVQEYRLIGYENRLLNKEDFENDAKDAGELGAGHTVTALYEIIPGPAAQRSLYIKVGNPKPLELGSIGLRYKKPNATKSKLLSFAIKGASTPVVEAHADLQHAAAVAAFGMWLRRSDYLGDFSLSDIQQLALQGMREDPYLMRNEFVELLGITAEMEWAQEQ